MINKELEDIELGYSIVRSNDKVEGVFIRDGEVVDIDYFDEDKETTVNKHEIALEQCWEIATDNSITEDNKIKMIRDVSRATLDGEPTTADEYNKDCPICGMNNKE